MTNTTFRLCAVLSALLFVHTVFAQNGGFYDARVQKHLTKASADPAALVVNATWQLDSMHCEDFDGNAWQPDYNAYYGYDAIGRQVYDSTATFDHNTLSWNPANKTYYYYLTGDLLDRSLEITWEGQGWGNDTFRIRNVYNNGQLAETYMESWEHTSNFWFSNGREEYIYDDQGLVIQRISSFYDEETETWVPIGRSNLEYLGDKLVNEINQFTNDNGQTWENFSQFHYTIENGHIAQLLLSIWAGQWTPFYRVEYTYDSRDLMVHSEAFQFNFGWQPSQRCDLFYGEQTTAVHTPAFPTAPILMANPFNGGTVSVPELDNTRQYRVSMFNAEGKTVTNMIVAGNRWQLSAPATPGLYVLTVSEGGRIVAQRKVVAGGQ